MITLGMINVTTELQFLKFTIKNTCDIPQEDLSVRMTNCVHIYDTITSPSPTGIRNAGNLFAG